MQNQDLESDGATFDAVDPSPAQEVHLDTDINGVLQPATHTDHRPANSLEVPIDTSANHAPPSIINLPNCPANSVLDTTPAVPNAPSRAISRSVSRSLSHALASPACPREDSPVQSLPKSRAPSPIQSSPGSPNPSPVHSRQATPSPSPVHPPRKSRRSARGNALLSAHLPVKCTRVTRRKGLNEDSRDTNAQGEPTPSSFSVTRNSKRQRPAADSVLPPAKRRHASNTDSTTTLDTSVPSAPLDIPTGSPTWFKNATSMFSAPSLGPRWSLLAQTWATFEMQENFQPRGMLSAAGRPQVVSDWIQRARPSTWRPTINDTKAYEKLHCHWWTLVQRKAGGDWKELRLPGPNGILSVLASLFYWGSAVRESRKSCKKWEAAVEDCIKVLAHHPAHL